MPKVKHQIHSSLALQHMRVHVLNDAEPRQATAVADKPYVLLWLQQCRRAAYSYAWQFAIKQARRQQVGLVVVEDLCAEQPWNARRHMAFALQGMQELQKALQGTSVRYFPLLCQSQANLQAALAHFTAAATQVVSDLQPLYVARQWLHDFAQDHPNIRVTAIDDNGLLPVNLLTQPPSAAAHFRRHVHRQAAAALAGMPDADPLADLVQDPLSAVAVPAAALATAVRGDLAGALADLHLDDGPSVLIDHGGRRQGLRILKEFITTKLENYAQRSDVSQEYSSGLAPYLHWGQISVWDIIVTVVQRDATWDPALLETNRQGARFGFWPLTEAGQLLLDELITWRELSYAAAYLDPQVTAFSGLPAWAQATLHAHAGDDRPERYTLDQLAQAETHDPFWNACQRQLVEHGAIHNYARMIWGKYVLSWQQPEEAWETLVELNNRYALDGRNPNSWSGIGWVFGRYDHPWQERPIIGTVRAMGIGAAKRHGNVKSYLSKYSKEKDLFNA
jgi:deoxyribodipyrimidine photo-lyase